MEVLEVILSYVLVPLVISLTGIVSFFLSGLVKELKGLSRKFDELNKEITANITSVKFLKERVEAIEKRFNIIEQKYGKFFR